MNMMCEVESKLLGGKKKGNQMRAFIGLVVFCFCQTAFAISIQAWDIKLNEYVICSIDEPTITSTKNNDGSTTHVFAHPIRTAGMYQEFYSDTAPRCSFQISRTTQASNLLGGWKLSIAPQDIALSTNAPNGFFGSLCGKNLSSLHPLIDTDFPDWMIQNTVSTEYITQTSGCKLTYSITLIKDPKAAGGTNKLCPLIDFRIKDMTAKGYLYAVSLHNKFTNCAVPDATPTPPNTNCQVVVKSAVKRR